MSPPHLTAHTRVQGGMTCSSLPITVEEHRSKYNQNINLLSALCSSSAVLVSDFIPQTQESFIFHLHLLCYWGGQVWPAVPIFSWIHDSWAVTLESVEVSIFTCYQSSHLAYTPGWSASAHPTPQLTTPVNIVESWKKIEKEYLFARSFDQEWPHHLLRK